MPEEFEFLVGDILHIAAPVASKRKYHICLGRNEYLITLCLFLNSSAFQGSLKFNNSAFPELPPTEDGFSFVSLTMLPRYTNEQLKIFGAKKLGTLKLEIANEIMSAAKVSKTLSGADKKFIITALSTYI